MKTVSGFLFLLVSIVAPATLDARNPNVIVILTDDQGWGDLSLNGNTNLKTPEIDALARAGARFDRFYVCPVCSPTRAEFLTGRYHLRSGVFSTSAGGERIDLDEMTIAQTFKAAGYATGAFGKWHNGMQHPYHPNARGFDEYYGFCSGHWGNYYDPMLEHNGRIVRGKGFIIDDLTDKAIEFIERNREKPFFAYIPYNTPHSPMQVPDRWWNKFKDRELVMRPSSKKRENLGHTRAALAMCENIDWNVGRILKKLEELKIADDTIVVFFHDNGPNGVRWNGDMKGRKGSTDEGGVRSPLLLRWPKRIPKGKKVKPIAAVIDLLPTLADCAGIPVVSKNKLDGRSLKPLLLGQKGRWKERIIFSHWKGRVSARTQNYRLDHTSKLFDMAKDPGQRTDISKTKTDVTTRLREQVARWKKTAMAELGKDTRPFVVGHPDFEWTQIPARDATAHGGLKRSNRFPNCSYFTNWTKLDDKLTWQVEVGAAGRYAVELHYAVRRGSEGAVMEVSFNGKRLRHTITQPHEVPARGQEHDRVPRAESFVKDFKAVDIGVIMISKGKGELMLRALKIPGQEALEFRLLMLRRVGASR